MRNVAAVILAAGGSSRLGEPKQFLDWNGESLIHRVVRVAMEGGCARILVIAGEAHERIAAEVRSSRAEIVHHSDWQRGLGSSIRAGVSRLIESAEETEGVVLLACDQPFLEAALIAALIMEWHRSGKAIVASRYAGTLGIPALFDRSCFASLLALPEEAGAKALIRERAEAAAEVEFADGAFDIDTVSDYDRAQARLRTTARQSL